MPENKSPIGLSWEPKLPSFSTAPKIESHKSKHPPELGAVWKPSTELVDGLFVPPNNPRKVNKLIRKQVKDTAGKNWYVFLRFLLPLFCSWLESLVGMFGKENWDTGFYVCSCFYGVLTENVMLFFGEIGLICLPQQSLRSWKRISSYWRCCKFYFIWLFCFICAILILDSLFPRLLLSPTRVNTSSSLQSWVLKYC